MKRNQQQYELPLKIVSYSELYGWSMDQIVKEVGLKNNCKRKRHFHFNFKLDPFKNQNLKIILFF